VIPVVLPIVEALLIIFHLVHLLSHCMISDSFINLFLFWLFLSLGNRKSHLVLNPPNEVGGNQWNAVLGQEFLYGEHWVCWGIVMQHPQTQLQFFGLFLMKSIFLMFQNMLIKYTISCHYGFCHEHKQLFPLCMIMMGIDHFQWKFCPF